MWKKLHTSFIYLIAIYTDYLPEYGRGFLLIERYFLIEYFSIYRNINLIYSLNFTEYYYQSS